MSNSLPRLTVERGVALRARSGRFPFLVASAAPGLSLPLWAASRLGSARLVLGWPAELARARLTIGRSVEHSEKKGRKKSCEFMFLFFLLRSLLTTVLRRTQKHRSKKRSGAAQGNPPFASCTTRHATALDAKRASAALPAGAAANGGGAPRKTLLTVLRMAWGGDRVDKRGLPAEQGKGVSCQE